MNSQYRKRRNRVIEKNGQCNVEYKQISKKRRRFITDAYTTLIDSSWPNTLLTFAASFYLTWLAFAILYYIICWHHGDLDPEFIKKELERQMNQTGKEASWIPCVLELEDFASAFLFSLETQHTIGYGSRQTTPVCTEAIIIMSTQSVLGCLFQAFMVGLVFAKLARPKHRARTVVFSKNAVILERDGKLCLVFRVGDMRDDSFIVGTQLSAKIIRRKCTAEGEMYHDTQPITIVPETSNEPCVLLIWPLTVLHVIDEDSPFYDMSASEMANDKFELVVGLEGTIESTSMTFQTRTSYLPDEILWGHRFEPMMLYRRDHNKYQVNFSAFDSTYEVDTPLCSSKDLETYNQAVTSSNYFNDVIPSLPPNQYSQHLLDPASPFSYPGKNQITSNAQRQPSTLPNQAAPSDSYDRTDAAAPLIEIQGGSPKFLGKVLPISRMESVVEQNNENSTSKSSPSCTPSPTQKCNSYDATTATPSVPVNAEDILTQKLLASSSDHASNGSSSEDNHFSEDNVFTQNTNDIAKSTEKLYDGNSFKNGNPEVV